MTISACPNPEELRAFTLGDLPVAELERIAGHLVDCSECNASLETMDHDADVLLRGLQQLPWQTPAPPQPLSGDVLALAQRAATATSSGVTSEISLDPGRRFAHQLAGGPCRLGKFELQAELGTGSFGYVFRAHDTELDRIVAVKIQRAGALASEEEVQRFLREARSVAQLQHPSIVALYETGQTDEGICFLVTEFVEGRTLEEDMHARSRTEQQIAALIAAIADALQYAHEHGVIHRDIKPSNIMIDETGQPHLMDFGLAKRQTGELTMTSDGRIVGTPAYMSPEQARGESHDVDARSDIYSLGVILYEMLTGERPFQGNRRLLLLQVLEDEPRPPRRLHGHIPRDLENICLKAMAKASGRRYQTAQDLANDLHRFLQGQTVQARPVGSIERLLRWCRCNPLAASLLLAISLGSLVGFLYLSSLSTWFVRATALDSARMEAEMLEQVNAYYSDLVDRLNRKRIRVTHDYIRHPGSLPLPATFTIEAGRRISSAESGMKVRLYSEYPWRPENGPSSTFEQTALRVLNKKVKAGEEDLTHFEFTEINGRPFLRFAKGQLMQQSCMKCHKNHKNKPSEGWHEGDLAGVLALTRPLDRDIARTRAGLRWASLLMATVAVLLMGLCLAFAMRARVRRTRGTT